MKKIALSICILCLCYQLKGQNGEYFDKEEPSKFYIGLGTGINSYTGILGISGNYRIENKLFLQAGFGLSSWGYRSSLGLRYDQSYNNGFIFGLALSNSSGIKDIDIELETINGDLRELNMNLNSAFAINLKTGYNWWIGENSTFSVDIGYSIALKDQPWEVKDGTDLSATSIQVLELIAPGGIIFGLGFTFGL